MHDGGHALRLANSSNQGSFAAKMKRGPVAELVGIEGGVVSGVFNPSGSL